MHSSFNDIIKYQAYTDKMLRLDDFSFIKNVIEELKISKHRFKETTLNESIFACLLNQGHVSRVMIVYASKHNACLKTNHWVLMCKKLCQALRDQLMVFSYFHKEQFWVQDAI